MSSKEYNSDLQEHIKSVFSLNKCYLGHCRGMIQYVHQTIEGDDESKDGIVRNSLIEQMKLVEENARLGRELEKARIRLTNYSFIEKKTFEARKRKRFESAFNKAREQDLKELDEMYGQMTESQEPLGNYLR